MIIREIHEPFNWRLWKEMIRWKETSFWRIQELEHLEKREKTLFLLQCIRKKTIKNTHYSRAIFPFFWAVEVKGSLISSNNKELGIYSFLIPAKNWKQMNNKRFYQSRSR